MAKAQTTKIETETDDSKGKSAGKTPFIDESTAYDAYDESRKWLRPYFDPLQEFERIARNKPSDKIDPSLPRITDGTMASIIQEDPKRVIQQMASGKVTSPDEPEWAPVGDIILGERLIPAYNRMGDALQKQWNMMSKSLTYGLSTSYTFFTSTNGKLHTDFVIPYVKDVIIEKGKVFAPDSNITFMRSWYQRRDLKAIIQKEQSLKAQDRKYESGWDLQALADFMETGASAKPADTMTPAEREKGDGNSGGYEVIHAFQKGIGACMYSFAPRMESGKQMLRTKVNKDPRGAMPLDFQYCNIDLSNPLGRGQVELSGGIQNLIDQQMQMFQFMTTLEMGPPLQVWGNVNQASLKFRPNAVWDMGSSLNNKVEPYTINNNAIANFAGNMQLLQSKILALNSSQDSSIGAQNNNAGQSKTQAGVQQSQMRLGVSDNYLRKQFEAWWGHQCETSLNIYFSEMVGEDSIDLTEQQIRELESTQAAKLIKNDKLDINYGQINDVVFRFQVDPASSKAADDQDQLQRLQELVQEVNADPLVINYYLGQDGKKLSLGEIYTQRFKRLGLENIDSILTDMSPEEADAAKKQPFPIIDKPQFRVNTADLTAEQIQAVLSLGGVPQQPAQQQPGGIPAGLSPQGIADFIVEMAKAQASGPSEPMGSDPRELQMKQQELALKQQAANDNTTKTALEVSKTAHQHAMEMHNAATTASQPQPIDPNSPEAIQAKAAAGQSQGATPVAPQQQQGPDSAGQQPDGLHALDPQEQQIVHHLFQRGFNEQDVEQAIMMLRQGMNEQQIIQAIGGKYAQQQA